MEESGYQCLCEVLLERFEIALLSVGPSTHPLRSFEQWLWKYCASFQRVVYKNWRNREIFLPQEYSLGFSLP
uniref:Uncharacterized protein n=1 Tax=Picea glauca TaxID=3330 RepID=A0A101LTP8_PICGL|nr:hypothetical protein ABT39_MTgene3602 [Picea glauca]